MPYSSCSYVERRLAEVRQEILSSITAPSLNLKNCTGSALPSDAAVALCSDIKVIESIEGYTRQGSGTLADPYRFIKDIPAPTGSLTFDSVVEANPPQTNIVTKSWVEGSGASDVDITLSWANLTPNSIIELELPFGPTSADIYKETVAGGLYSTIPTASGTLSIKPKNYLLYGGGTCVPGTYTWTIKVDGKTATRQIQIV